MNADWQTRAYVASAAISTALNRKAPMAYAIAKASQDVSGIHVHEPASVFPATAVMVGGLEGGSFTFR